MACGGSFGGRRHPDLANGRALRVHPPPNLTWSQSFGTIEPALPPGYTAAIALRTGLSSSVQWSLDRLIGMPSRARSTNKLAAKVGRRGPSFEFCGERSAFIKLPGGRTVPHGMVTFVGGPVTAEAMRKK